MGTLVYGRISQNCILEKPEGSDLDAWTTRCAGTSPPGKSQHTALDRLHFQQGFSASLTTAAALELCCGGAFVSSVKGKEL